MEMEVGEEIWKDVVGYEGCYIVSNLGNIRGCDRFVKHGTDSLKRIRGILMRPALRKGYYSIQLSKNDDSKMHTIHRLVAMAFIPNPENKPQINHKDGDKLNNNVDNLEWATASENIKHGFRTGLFKQSLLNPNFDRTKHYANKRVVQLDLNGNVVNIFNSRDEASRITGVDASMMVRVIKRKPHSKTAGGFIWRDASEFPDLDIAV